MFDANQLLQANEQREHEESLAKIEAKKARWQRSPFWYSVCELLEAVVIVAVIATMAQCSCSGCVW